MVSANHSGGRSRREFRSARLHGHQAVGLRSLGANASRPRRMFKATGHRNAYFPLHPVELPGEGGAHVEGFAKVRCRYPSSPGE